MSLNLGHFFIVKLIKITTNKSGLNLIMLLKKKKKVWPLYF